MVTCMASIPSPWRFGMVVTCQKREGHDGLHSWQSASFEGGGVEVHWSGQHDKFTERERRQQQRG